MLWDRGILQGKIIRPMRIVDPEQDEYCGLVQVGDEGEGLIYSIFTVFLYSLVG